MIWSTLGLTLAAYLLGSLPFGVIVGYIVTGRDIRAAGSGHSGATNTIRQAGWAAGAVVIALDVGKGALAAWLAQRFGDGLLAPALAAGAAVAGHCWPIFAGFRGGMGLATAGGVMLVLFPLGFVAGLGLLVAMAFVLRHSARAGFATSLFNVPLVWLLSQSPLVTAAAAAFGLVVAVRALSDWNRRQRAVWAVTEQPDDKPEPRP